MLTEKLNLKLVLKRTLPIFTEKELLKERYVLQQKEIYMMADFYCKALINKLNDKYDLSFIETEMVLNLRFTRRYKHKFDYSEIPKGFKRKIQRLVKDLHPIIY